MFKHLAEKEKPLAIDYMLGVPKFAKESLPITDLHKLIEKLSTSKTGQAAAKGRGCWRAV